VNGIQPSVTILEEATDGRAPSRLKVPGCILNCSWRHLQDEAGSESHVYSCEATLCGEAGAVILTIQEETCPEGLIVIPALKQLLNILAGVSHMLDTGVTVVRNKHIQALLSLLCSVLW
jgi:hypothetical protein